MVISQWNRLPQEVVTAPSLSQTKEHLNDTLSHKVHFEVIGNWIQWSLGISSHSKIFHDFIASFEGLFLTKWASTLSLTPTVSFKSELVLKLTGSIPAPALKGLDNPWKGSVQKAGVQEGCYSGLKSIPNCNKERAPRAWSRKSNTFHPETAKDIMGGWQEYEYVSANQCINANFISASDYFMKLLPAVAENQK